MKVSKTHHRTRRGVIKRNPVRNFKSKVAYERWLAYGHIHGVFEVPGNQRITIRGKPHRVKH